MGGFFYSENSEPETVTVARRGKNANHVIASRQKRGYDGIDPGRE